jgi:hypothetical protein
MSGNRGIILVSDSSVCSKIVESLCVDISVNPHFCFLIKNLLEDIRIGYDDDA